MQCRVQLNNAMPRAQPEEKLKTNSAQSWPISIGGLTKDAAK